MKDRRTSETQESQRFQVFVERNLFVVESLAKTFETLRQPAVLVAPDSSLPPRTARKHPYMTPSSSQQHV